VPGHVAITFDNLGEAADLERGLWPEHEPLGYHESVTRALPWLLDALDRLELRATFCVEAINCEMYPDAVRGIAARGHDVAMHGWRHEHWVDLSREREEQLLRRGRAAFAALEVPVAGFRPPGGEPSSHTRALLAHEGFTWCSPSARAPEPASWEVAIVPFAWALVDASYRLESFAGHDRLSPEATASRLCAELDRTEGDAVLVLHPFLMTDDAGAAAAETVLSHVRELGVPAGPIAA
jgi:peptidoglycan/xylan/chitin deacetylase (PgdA/CDA1 family)